jgi:predicted hotdog family 3-hydroxylacyl-ACP dehydratase
MSNFPDVATLVPHEAPMILIDKLIHVDENSVHCQVFINYNSPLFDEQIEAVGAWVGIEYMAQAISAWSGYQSFLKSETSPIGFLLGSRRYTSNAPLFKKGDVLDIYAQKLLENDGMGVFSCSIKCADKEIANGQLNVFVPNKEQLESMLKGKSNE